jgi:hypothetical protein
MGYQEIEIVNVYSPEFQDYLDQLNNLLHED